MGIHDGYALWFLSLYLLKVKMYSNDEKTDMILIYGECKKNASAAARLYRQRFPNRRAPADTIFKRLELTLRTNWPPLKKSRERTATGPDNEIRVLEMIDENPHISQRVVSRATGISLSSVHRIIKGNQFHPYHLQLVQALKETDYPKRLAFCNFFREHQNLNVRFYDNICFSDEARFSNNGGVNKHNMHYYAQENPRWIREGHFQTIYSTNVWCGILGNQIVGPYFFRDSLNGNTYLNFLRNILPVLLQNVNLQVRQDLWFQQDGAPAHYHRIVRNHLDLVLPNRWIGRGSINPWPPRSPDLTPLDFFLWGMVKEQVYQTPIESVEHLENKIRDACRSITPEMLMHVKRSFWARIQACENSGGRHFEHLLH